MEIMFIIMPIALFIGIVFMGGLFWAVKAGQWDDMVGPAYRILDEEDKVSLPHSRP